MTASERRRRDAAIVGDRARGLTWPELAGRHNVSERIARRAVEAWYRRAPAELDGLDPDAVVRETLAMLEQSIGDYALLSLTATGEAVRLGAMKARDDAARHRLLVLQSVGWLPPDWQRWRYAQEERKLFERLVDVLRRRPDVPDDVVTELLAELER